MIRGTAWLSAVSRQRITRFDPRRTSIRVFACLPKFPRGFPSRKAAMAMAG
jgi:hypothetical protein